MTNHHEPQSKSDSIVDAFVAYARSVEYEALPADVVHATKVRLIDTFGALIGGFFGEPSRISRAVSAHTTSPAAPRSSARATRRRWTWRPSSTA